MNKSKKTLSVITVAGVMAISTIQAFAATTPIGDNLSRISSGYVINASEVYSASSTSSNYNKKASAFLADKRWKNGTSWGSSQRPKLSTYGASGCCAYAVDFCKYVFNKNSYTAGKKFTNPKDIKAGDVIKVLNSQHWFVVIERNGDKLKTAEGNWGGKVVVSNGVYTVKNNTLYRNGKKFRTFSAGYHMK